MWDSGKLIFAVALVATVGVAAFAKEIYVSPEGTPNGPGTREAPYDLATVLKGKVVDPGDTVWLMGGTYPGPEADVELKDKDGKPTGQKERRRVAFVSELAGTKEKPIILRAMPNERVTLDGFMEVKGAHTWYWGFEIADSRYAATDHSEEACKKLGVGTGINVFGPGTKFINLDVHDGSMGFGCWSPAVDAEIYGCLIHHFGYAGKDRGHGHAIYAQNETGTKRFVDNVMFNGCGWNVHVYTQGGQVKGFHLEGNISFSSGMLAESDPNPKDNYLLSAYQPLDRITMIRNVAYDPRTPTYRPNVRLSPYKGRNVSGEVKDNYFMGLNGLQVTEWEQMTITGNTVWAPGSVVKYARAKDDKWTVEGNTYICLPDRTAFNGMTFEEYRKATGFDQRSTLIPLARPDKNFIFIRPNQYEPGRANVAVFNWEGRPTVDLDLSSVLKVGDTFEVRNVQNFYGPPVASGRYDGKPVAVPMLKSKIAPDFDAFVVLTVRK